MLEAAREDATAFQHFPTTHWRQIWSTDPLERVDKEITRRTDVVGVFPNPAALLRPAGAVLIEQHDERDAADRRYSSEPPLQQLDTTDTPVTTPEITAAWSAPLAEHCRGTPPLNGTRPWRHPPRLQRVYFRLSDSGVRV